MALGRLNTWLSSQGARLDLPGRKQVEEWCDPLPRHHRDGDELEPELLNGRQHELMKALQSGAVLEWSDVPGLSLGAREILMAHESRFDGKTIVPPGESLTP